MIVHHSTNHAVILSGAKDLTDVFGSRWEPRVSQTANVRFLALFGITI